MSTAKSILVRVLVTLGAIILVAYNVDFSLFAAVLGRTSASGLPALVSLTILSWFLKCWRLQTLFPRQEGVSVRGCSLALGMGVLGNLVLPLRAGDLLRCAVLKHVSPTASVHGIITTFAVEKLLEMVAIALILCWWAYLLVLPPDVGAAAGRVITAAVLAVAAFSLAWAQRGRFAALLARLGSSPGPAGQLARRVLTILDDVRRFFSWRRIAAAGIQTAVLRLVDATTFLLLASAVGLSLSLPQAFLVMALIAIATALPAAPGYLGTYEAAGVIALSLFGMGKAEALAYALASHVWFIATWLVVGLLSALCLPFPLRAVLASPATAPGKDLDTTQPSRRSGP